LLLSGILDYTDAAIGKVEKLSDDVKQYQSERADQEIERVVELMAPAVLSNVAEQEYQYGRRLLRHIGRKQRRQWL